MSKKPLEDDLLTGGSIAGDEKEKSSKNLKKSNKKPANIKISKKASKIIKISVCVVVILAILVTYVATGAVRKGFIASLSLPAETLNGVTITNGEEKAKIKVATYNFYFASTYNSLVSQKQQYEQYGIDASEVGLDVDFDKKLSSQTYTDKETNEKMSWDKHLEELVLDSIEETYTYYLEAVKANDGKEPEITEAQKTELNDTLKSYRETAEKYGYTLSGYLVKAMGKGVTENVFRTEMTRQYIAQNYQSDLTGELAKKEYNSDDIKNYKNAHAEELKAVDILLFECSNEDNAKEFKSKLKADGSNFAALASEYSSNDFDKKNNKDIDFLKEVGVTRDTLIKKSFAIAAQETSEDKDSKSKENAKYPGLDWLFDSSRKAGDIYQYSTSVVYVVSPASIQDRNTVNVRHILIAPETDDKNSDISSATDAQWQAAFEKAQGILNEWKSGDANEKSFAALAEKNTKDTGSASNGGLYEDVTTGQMVNPFSAWCFESGRKSGDTAIVKSEYGYHIMYFVKTNDEKIWEYNAKHALAEDDSASLTDKLEEDYTRKVNWFGSRYFQKDVDIDS